MHVIHIDDTHNFRVSYNNHESLRISFNIELELRVGTNSLLFIRSDCIGGVGGVAVVLLAPTCSPPTAAPAAAGVEASVAAVPPTPAAAVASIGIAVGTFEASDASACLPILNNVGRVCVFDCGCDSCSKNCTNACTRLSLPGK